MVVLTESLILQKTKVDNLAGVKNLNLWGSDLTDVSIVSSLPNLEVLALSVNHVSSLKPLADCRSLRELYLRKNDVAQLGEVYHLRNLPHLTVLWLCDNPCAGHPLYRTFTIKCCPSLRQFDNVEVSPQERAQADRITQPEVNEIVARLVPTGAAAAAVSSAVPSAAARGSSAELRDGPRAGRRAGDHASSAEPASRQQIVPPVLAAAQQAAAAAPVVSRQTQKAMLSAIMTLMAELSTESLDFLQGEIGERLRQRRGQ